MMSNENRVRLTIKDTGAGLAPEQLEQLFQPFNRLGQEANRGEGTGIGLVVTKKLVELMEGTIGVESSVGVGSLFWVELKTSGLPELAIDSMTAVQDQAPVHTLSAQQRTLLYVEDNPGNLLLVEQLIEQHNDWKLVKAINGCEGIQLARDYLPDVILMDINLPDISGFDALKILREDPITAHIPVWALTANTFPHEMAKGLEAGFFRYLTKPINVTEFMEALDAALDYPVEKGLVCKKSAEPHPTITLSSLTDFVEPQHFDVKG
jgi:CheY-like chemotaxis protein